MLLKQETSTAWVYFAFLFQKMCNTGCVVEPPVIRLSDNKDSADIAVLTNHVFDG